MTQLELVDSLLEQAQKLPLRDSEALDALRRRAEMIIRRVFGDSSPYLKSVDNIQFLPRVHPSSKHAEIWQSGQSEIINLIKTMAEELRVFESTPTPVLAIHDEELRNRTADLLSAPANYDRVLREATTVLEDRIRRKVPFKDLAQLIPDAGDQTGDNLINKLFSPGNPVIRLGERPEQVRLHRMLGGVISYLRNPAHHTIDDSVKWSWAWSSVGLVDRLLDDLETASYQRPASL